RQHNRSQYEPAADQNRNAISSAHISAGLIAENISCCGVPQGDCQFDGSLRIACLLEEETYKVLHKRGWRAVPLDEVQRQAVRSQRLPRFGGRQARGEDGGEIERQGL